MSDSTNSPNDDDYTAEEIAKAIRTNRPLPDKSGDAESVENIVKAIPRTR